MKIQTRWFLLVLALVAAALLAGCGQKKGESETPPQASRQAAPGQRAARSAETSAHGEAGEKVAPAETPMEIWAQITAEQDKLASAIQNGQLKDVHHLAFGVRDLVIALADKTHGLSASDAATLSGLVDQVKHSAGKLDELGDAGNLSGTQAEYDGMSKVLISIKALAGSKS